MEAFGLTAEDLDFDIEVFPDNEAPLQLFLAMGTQWRLGGLGSRIGLDYNALPIVEERLGLADRRRDLFPALQVMENKALRVWREQQEVDARSG